VVTSGRNGLGLWLSQFAEGRVAATIDTLEIDDMRPVDLALSGISVACLAEDPADSERPAPPASRPRCCTGFCQKLEQHLRIPI